MGTIRVLKLGAAVQLFCQNTFSHLHNDISKNGQTFKFLHLQNYFYVVLVAFRLLVSHESGSIVEERPGNAWLSAFEWHWRHRQTLAERSDWHLAEVVANVGRATAVPQLERVQAYKVLLFLVVEVTCLFLSIRWSKSLRILAPSWRPRSEYGDSLGQNCSLEG